MKIRLTINLFFLMALGMVLINLVVMFLWKHDLMEIELEKAHATLARVIDIAGASLNDKNISQIYTKVFPEDPRGGVVLTSSSQQILIPEHFSLSSSLTSFLARNKTGEEEVVRINGVFEGVASSDRQAMLVVKHCKGRNGERISAALALSLVPVYSKLWNAEKTVLIYIVINLLLLTVIGFFRIAQIAVKPIDRLVGLAEQYKDETHLLFEAENSGNEYSRLATSLNSMLDRIKRDRVVLQENVRQLDLANRQLKSNQQEMIRTEKLASVGRMAAGLAHEIGNPLGVVQGYLGLLGRSKSLVGEEERDFIRRAEDELQRVNTLIRQMLDFARVSEGAPEEFSVHDLVTSVVEMVRMQPAFKTVTIDCLLDAEQDIVHADQDQLRQVLVNCLINSADAVNISERKEKGLVTVATRLSTLQSGAELKRVLCMDISDNGTGIAKEHQAVVFDPFFTTKEPGKGTGLGLSVSYAIIERLQGQMSIKNNETAGAVVEICLPLAGQVDHAISAHAVSQ